MRAPVLVFATAALAAAARLPAQDNAAAGLFTEARQLPLVSQSISLKVVGGQAELRLVQVFANDGDAVAQADYHLYVPQRATVTGFGFWNRGEFLAAALREREEAERRHRVAAEEGRATGLLRQESRIHTFSVYPLAAGELKTVETSLQIPVVYEMGRSHVRVPVDSFLGQPGPPSSLLVDLVSEDTIADFGTDAEHVTELARTDRRLHLALSTRRAVEIGWTEAGPPLRARADQVPLEEGDLGLQVRLALGDAKGLARPYGRLHVLVDGSHSMRRRAPAVRAFLDRVLRRAEGPVEVHLLAERELRFNEVASPDAIVDSLLAGAAGHQADWGSFASVLAALDCGAAERRCAVLTDAQLEGLDEAPSSRVPLLVLADPHELAWAGDRIPAGAGVYLPGVDPEARLLERVDQCVLPLFTLRGLWQEGQALPLPPRAETKAAAGGLLRVFVRTASRSPVTLVGDLEGAEKRLELTPTVLEKDSEAGAALRRAVYQELLAGWMETYRRGPDPDLKRQIVEVSVREGVPTAFTALQVDDPRLSLTAIKPGDPLVTVPAEPGLRAVVVWYPFGEMRRLSHDPQSGAFLDRFLVPRGWREGPYRVELFKHYEGGEVKRAQLWYELDERGPAATVTRDAASGLVRIDTGRATSQVSTVQVHTEGGRVLPLSPVGTVWAVPAAELPKHFTVVLRDLAGNRTVLACRFAAGGVRVEPEPRAPALAGGADAPASHATSAPGPLRLDGDAVVLTLDGRTYRVPAGHLGLRSLDLRAAHRLGDDIVVGTTGGDLVALHCAPDGECRGRRLTDAFAHHAVVGLAPLEGKGLLVGVLGRGLYELRGGRVRRSRYGVGTRFVTALGAGDGSVYVATANNGLWTLRGGRLRRMRFPHDHVAGLTAGPDGLLVTSGFGRYRLGAGGRFARLDDGLAALPQGTPRLTAAVEWRGGAYVGSFDRGLFRLGPGGLEPLELGLAALERQINALAVFDGALWLGTEGGLLEVAALAPHGVRRALTSAVHGLAAGPRGLAAAASGGLFVVREDHVARRLGTQSGPGRRGVTAVAWWGGAVYAGGLDGLFRVDVDAGEVVRPVSAAEGFPARWVTALLPVPQGLLIGTYDQGVHLLRAGRVEPLLALAGQWVPPGGLSPEGQGVWVGGIGMAPVHFEDGRASRLSVPTEDVYNVLSLRNERILLGSEGLIRAR